MFKLWFIFVLGIIVFPYRLAWSFEIAALKEAGWTPAELLRGLSSNEGVCQAPDLFVLVDRQFFSEDNSGDTIEPILSLLSAAISKCNARGSLIEYGSNVNVVSSLQSASSTATFRQALSVYSARGPTSEESNLGPALDNVLYQLERYGKKRDLATEALIFVIGQDADDFDSLGFRLDELATLRAQLVVLHFGQSDYATRLASDQSLALEVPESIKQIAEATLALNTMLCQQSSNQPSPNAAAMTGHLASTQNELKVADEKPQQHIPQSFSDRFHESANPKLPKTLSDDPTTFTTSVTDDLSTTTTTSTPSAQTTTVVSTQTTKLSSSKIMTTLSTSSTIKPGKSFSPSSSTTPANDAASKSSKAAKTLTSTAAAAPSIEVTTTSSSTTTTTTTEPPTTTSSDPSTTLEDEQEDEASSDVTEPSSTMSTKLASQAAKVVKNPTVASTTSSSTTSTAPPSTSTTTSTSKPASTASASSIKAKAPTIPSTTSTATTQPSTSTVSTSTTTITSTTTASKAPLKVKTSTTTTTKATTAASTTTPAVETSSINQPTSPSGKPSPTKSASGTSPSVRQIASKTKPRLINVVPISTSLPDPAVDASKYCLACLNRRNPKDMYANPNDCHSYYQCIYDNSHATAKLRNCPPGTFWREEVLGCLPEGPIPCQDACQNDTVAAHGCYGVADDCGKFFTCSNTASYAQCCPTGTSFNALTCSCVHDDECISECMLSYYTHSTKAPLKPSHTGNTCTDAYGSTFRGVSGADVFEMVEDVLPGRIAPRYIKIRCAPGTRFSLEVCRCEIPVDVELDQPSPISDDRRCLLYMPFDRDFKDYSSSRFLIYNYGNVELASGESATAQGGSLRLRGGSIEVPGLKTSDLRDRASWCLFFRCENADGSYKCSRWGGLLSNNNDAETCDQSITLGTNNDSSIVARLKMHHPFNRLTISGNQFNMSANGWVQVCVVYDGTFAKLYINGAGVNAVASGGNLAISHCPYTLGNDHKLGAFFGSIDDVLVCPHAMTSDEIRAHYDGNRAYLQSKGLIPQ